jgi:hypothetical protein
MKTISTFSRSSIAGACAMALALSASLLVQSARAGENVFWSIGVGTPGLVLQAGNAVPVYVQPQPVYVQPAPMYVVPQPVLVQPQPRYYSRAPQVVYVQPGYRHGEYRRHRRGHGRDDEGDDHQD